MQMVVATVSRKSPSAYSNCWIRLTAGMAQVMAVANEQFALKNLRGEDNYALA
jgi:hypothetical protein